MADDVLRQRYAEALAEKFTSPIPRMERGMMTDEIADPLPADRVNRTMSVRYESPDGPSFGMVTCMQAAEVCAAVRDEEVERLRRALFDAAKLVAEDLEGHEAPSTVPWDLAKLTLDAVAYVRSEWDSEAREAERLQEETGLLLDRAHKAEKHLYEASEALMRVRGVLHEGRSDADTLAIIRRQIGGPLSERDRELEEARRDRDIADFHWGRVEAVLARVRALADRWGTTDPDARDELLAAIDGPAAPEPPGDGHEPT